MEPNQNTNMQSTTSVPIAASVPTESSTSSSTPSKLAESSKSGDDIVFRDKPKKSHGMLYGMVLLAILAIGGIAFGVWEMMDGNSQVAEKDKQIAELRGQLAEKNQTVVEDNTTVVDVETGDNAEASNDASDYIYVGEWGLKIRIPEGLNRVSYAFKQHGGASQTEGTTVSVYGTLGDGLPDFANPYKNKDALGAISKVSKDAYSGPEYDGVEEERRACGVDGGLVFSDDSYNYCYSHPQAVYSISEEEKDLEVRSTELIKTMLTNSDNYHSF